MKIVSDSRRVSKKPVFSIPFCIRIGDNKKTGFWNKKNARVKKIPAFIQKAGLWSIIAHLGFAQSSD